MSKNDRLHSVSRVGKRAQNAAPTRSDRGRIQRAPTLAESQYDSLLARITSMDLPPGTAISDAEIAQDAGISRTPVREAVQRLANEGLVEIVPKSGTFVSRIPVSALPEAILARRALEGMTARAAAAFATKSQVLSLRSVLEEHRECEESGDKEGFHASDERFHEMVATIGRVPGLWRLIQQSKLQLDRFRRLTLPEEGRLSLVVAEHSAVIDAIEAGDQARAEQAMESHLSGLQLHISTIVEANPDFFWVDSDPTDLLRI